MAKKVKKVSSFILPQLGAAGGFANGLIQGQGLGGALKGGLQSGLSAAGTIAGGTIGASLFPGTIGSILGKSAANAVGSTIANTSIGSKLGSFAGNAISNSISDSIFPQKAPKTAKPPASQGPAPFEPKQEPQLQLPNSLSSLSSLDPNQISSNIATQGVYGEGQGPEEESYFTNLINRRLVDETGQVDKDLTEVSPIENSYLAQLGLSGYTNPSSLLEAIYGRKQKQVQA